MRRLADLVVRWPWAVIGVWVAMSLALPLTFPSLGEMAEKHPLVILPSDAPSSVTATKMAEAFQEPGSDNLLVVAFINETGLKPADEATYRKLVDALRDDVTDVVSVQDFVSTPQLRQFLTSEDKTTWVLPVSLEGELGTPRAFESFNRVADIVEHNVPTNDVAAGGPLTVYVTGPAATVADLTVAGQQDRLPIEIAIAVLVLPGAVAGLPQRGHDAAAVGDDRIVAGHRAGRGGRLLPADRLGRLEPVHHFSERDHGRRRNGLRGLSHQPLSRLSAVGC